MHALAIVAASVLASGLAAAPATPVAGGPGPASEMSLGVTFTPRDDRALDRAPLLGELDLHLLADGKIVGFYRPESDRTPIALSGAWTPGSTFLDIGSGIQSFHIEGTLKDENGVADGFAGSASIGNARYDVAAVPCRDARGSLSILCQ